jgi:hypothetical protein
VFNRPILSIHLNRVRLEDASSDHIYNQSNLDQRKEGRELAAAEQALLVQNKHCGAVDPSRHFETVVESALPRRRRPTSVTRLIG